MKSKMVKCMDWNKYLLDTIRKRIETDSKTPMFMLADSEGIMHALNNNVILEFIDHYINELKIHFGKICVIYHNIDEMLIGFIIAAFRCNVKILIRRTTLDSAEAICEDMKKLEKALPIHLVYTKDGIKTVGNSAISTSADSSDFDFIQLSSGTTEASKAFCLSIEGLVKSAQHIEKVQHVDANSIFLSYLTLSHIYGFVSGFILPIISGAKGLFCKTGYIKDAPELLFSIIAREKVTHTSAIMSTLIQGINNKSRDWDLSSLVCVSLGGEKVDIDTFNMLLAEMNLLGMRNTALVNSYGMSEKGSISMEDPYNGNTLYEINGSTYVSVGNDSFEDIEIIIIDDNLCKISENKEGMIGIASLYLAIGYFKENSFYSLEYTMVDNRKYYCNGDKGFINDNKVFVTDRVVNTVTYNGLKIAAYLLNESINRLLKKHCVKVNRCYTFNYPNYVNCVVCFIDCSEEISDIIKKDICEKVEIFYHIKISSIWADSYEGHGLNKISLPDIIKKYECYLKEK